MNFDEIKLDQFQKNINAFKQKLSWTRSDLVTEFENILPGFNHKETGKFLDSKM
jgi:hypothetical protein